MSLVPFENLGTSGIITDIPPYNLPEGAWSSGNNVRFLDNGVKKIAGYKAILDNCPFPPYYITPYLASDGTYYWVAFGATSIAVHNGSNWTDITRQEILYLDGAITAGATSFIVDAGTALNNLAASGYLFIGNDTTENQSTNRFELITYSAVDVGLRTITCTATLYDHADRAYIIPAQDTATINDAYQANETNYKWSTTNLNGLLIATNGIDPPQKWQLNGGIPNVQHPFVQLINWPSKDWSCKSIRSFKTFLVGLNWTRTNPEPRLVKWSTEASYGAEPFTWSETDATLDAGEYELSDTAGEIVDGVALGDSFLIYKTDSIYVMNYIGTPYIFSFKLLSPNIGALSRNAIAEYEHGHFFIGNNDCYHCNGQQVHALLPNKVKREMFESLQGDDYEKCYVVADHNRTEMLACFPTTNSSYVNRALIWNWTTNVFSFRDLPSSAHIGYGIAEISEGTFWGQETLLDGALGSGDTTITVDSTTGFNSSGTIIIEDEQIAYTGITSTTFTGCTRGSGGTTATTHADNTTVNKYVTSETWDIMAGVWGSKNYESLQKSLVFCDIENTKIYRDNFGNTKDGTNMLAYIERTGIDLNDAQAVKFVSAVYPQIEISGNNTVNVYVGRQISPEDSVTWEGPIAFNPDTQSKVSCRVSGKYFGVKIESNSDIDWKLHGVTFEVQKRGLRGKRDYG